MTNKEMASKRDNLTRRKSPACPECGSSVVVPIIHGVITPSLQKSIDEGKAVRADREEWEGMTEWYCKRCGCDWCGNWKRFKRPVNFPPR